MIPQILKPIPPEPSTQGAQINYRQWRNHPVTIDRLNTLNEEHASLIKQAELASLHPDSQQKALTLLQNAANYTKIINSLTQ